MRQSPFVQLTRVRIDASNLLKARMIITTYNEHVRLLSSEPFGCFAPPKSTRAWEPTLFMESLHSKCPDVFVGAAHTRWGLSAPRPPRGFLTQGMTHAAGIAPVSRD